MSKLVYLRNCVKNSTDQSIINMDNVTSIIEKSEEKMIIIYFNVSVGGECGDCGDCCNIVIDNIDDTYNFMLMFHGVKDGMNCDDYRSIK